MAPAKTGISVEWVDGLDPVDIVAPGIDDKPALALLRGGSR